MFNRSDLNALLITIAIILLGYISMHLLVYLDEYDLYLSIRSKGINEIIFQQLIENELNDRDLLNFKINEDQFESKFNQVMQ